MTTITVIRPIWDRVKAVKYVLGCKMNELVIEEEILIESADTLDERLIDSDSVDLRFRQKIPSKAYHANFRIENGSELHASVRTFKKLTQFKFNLAYLDLTPRQQATYILVLVSRHGPFHATVPGLPNPDRRQAVPRW